MNKSFFPLATGAAAIAAVILAWMGASSVTVAKPLQDAARGASASSRVTDSGALIEPSRRMRFKDGPWDYEVRIALPPSYSKGEKAYPVIWVTDGSKLFESAVDIVNFSAKNYVPEMIVVSIGTPPEAQKEFTRRRAYDFSATTNDICSHQEPGDRLPGAPLRESQCRLFLRQLQAAGLPSIDHLGGAPKFLAFISGDLRKQLSKDYRMANDHTLVGYSGGGYFCTYALLARPEGFDRYICGSADLYYDGGLAFQMEEQYAKDHKDMKAKVFFSAGEGEVVEGGIVSAEGVASGTMRMAELLSVRAYPSLELHARVFPGEVHDGSGVRTGLYWGLRTLWATNVKPSADLSCRDCPNR